MDAERRPRARRSTPGRLLLRAAVLAGAFLGLVVFSVALAKVTLTPSPASADLVTSNLRPGRSLRQYAEDYTFLAACKQAGGNLLLGMPFGLLLPVLVPRRLRMIRMVLLTALVITVVELVQGALVVGRAFDVDDVILNTAGALLGYVLIGRRISHRYHALADAPAAGPPPAPRRSAPARTTRGRALVKKWRSGRSGPGGGAPGPDGRGA
ncbi:VanZ family protein [Streptomyces halstedii]|uniref:VanZ family protein n=1 Tax=Streptomyces halstedii TaxID=1944 RepID=UPI0032481BD0